MAVPTLPNTDITKLDQTDDFKQNITDVVNAFVKTSSSSAGGTALGQTPFLTNAPISGSVSSTNYGGVAPLLVGSTVSSAPLPVDLTGTNVVASVFITLFQNTAQVLSRARRYTMFKQYLAPGATTQLTLGFAANIVAVNSGTDLFTIAGNFTSGVAVANFAIGTSFTVSGNGFSAANKAYTVVNKVPNGGNTDITVSPGTIPGGTTVSGIATPDRYAHMNGTYQIIQANAATTGNISLSGPQTIDGVAVVAGNIVLVKNQGTGSQNGVYTVAAGAWTRTPGFNDLLTVIQGVVVGVLAGTANANTYWQHTTGGAITIGVTALTFSLLSTVTAAGNVSAAGLTTLVNNFGAAVASHRDAVVPFTETWCHSSCHSSHSSRGRR